MKIKSKHFLFIVPIVMFFVLILVNNTIFADDIGNVDEDIHTLRNQLIKKEETLRNAEGTIKVLEGHVQSLRNQISSMDKKDEDDVEIFKQVEGKLSGKQKTLIGHNRTLKQKRDELMKTVEGLKKQIFVKEKQLKKVIASKKGEIEKAKKSFASKRQSVVKDNILKEREIASFLKQLDIASKEKDRLARRLGNVEEELAQRKDLLMKKNDLKIISESAQTGRRK
ncbi:MAG: hypothetical protein P9X22_01590 [Candidatus Zapsychrus exili]|nr:hypothetical protein [Candidatus Zapsychrus exili]